MATAYAEFLDGKTQLAGGEGFDPLFIPEYLFPVQSHLVDWSVRMGRSAMFADCGLGKTLAQLVWAENVYRHTGKPVLVVTPLAVGFQTESEADRFGIDAEVSRDGSVPSGITVTNYERLEKFNPDTFGGVVCDESSAIKAFDGERRAIVTEFMRTRRYRLLCTATAAPNDYVELGTSSEALGYLGHMDMLGRFFTNKQNTADTKNRFRGAAQGWRFKGHAQQAFWRWVASWARAVRKPSDLGYSDDGFVLPELVYRQHLVEAVTPREGTLFDVPAVGLHEEREETRRTLRERCERAAAALVDADTAVAWCHLNDESRLLTQLIPGAVEVSGADSVEAKEEKLSGFSRGEIPVLVTKPSIGAWGLNWQHCHRFTYFPSHSYEQFYQAVRRFWRFGQQSTVVGDIITTPGGANTLENLQRKATQADAMFNELTAHMRDALALNRTDKYDQDVEVPAWITT